MTLNRQIVLVLIAGISLYTAVGFAFNQFLILPSFRALEAQEAQKDMKRCLGALDAQLDQIATLCADWSAWDDTYAFVEALDPAYVEANLYPSWFVDNDMGVMYFVRRDGAVAWGRHFDAATSTLVPFPEFDGRNWRDDSLLRHSHRDSVVKGILRTSLGPMLVVSRPIVHSETVAGEEIRGALIMGRILDSEIISEIREQTQVALNIIDLQREAIPPEAIGLAEGEIRVEPESDEIIRALTHSHDLYGRDTLVFDITIPRLILARGASAIRLNMLAAGITGFVFLIMALLAMKWIVTDPLQTLATHVRSIGTAHGLAPAPLAKRGDEIGEVAREFNHMLERLRAEEEELIAAEAALRASQARMRTILETAPDAILIVDDQERVESANHAAARLFGEEEDQLRGRTVSELLPRDCADAWRAMMARARGPVRRADGELACAESGGGQRTLHATVSATELEGEARFTCAIRDISALKAMQESIARSQHLARIGEMGATVAHEIRNPLAGMKAALQIMDSGALDAEESGKVLAEIQILIDRISSTVEHLLRYARPIIPRPETVSLRNMVESVCNTCPIRPRHDAPARWEGVADAHLRADPGLLRQVLENIWANACQAVSPGGAIRWSAVVRGDEVELRLENDGPPIDEGDLPHVFEPFYTTRVEGSGLGLAVTQRIVEAHGGSVYIENVGKSGVAVVVRLPKGE